MSALAPPSGWEVRYVDLATRAEISEDRKIKGYAIVFNAKSLDLGGFTEIIKPQAVDRTFRENTDVRAYFNHDPALVLGRRSAGTLAIKKDTHGLAIEITPPDTTMAKDLVKSIRRGDISGMSFRFQTLTDDWHMEDGEAIRSISDMRIGEVSVVSEPAYPQTDVAVRSLREFTQLKMGHSLSHVERHLRARGIR